ncbi:GspS/AspS pilotin family protein [Vibrio coralliilyticus]|uniref:GspS/AspS pilotin family protein n=1 Tax=Vibrio coralliilyticus TaxID=190893 RepID=UPI0015616A73|nr:GspS/AspS pilotin family protein [Vibrio coralliilyticus]NRF28147.1 GspS/AspS pilotin family protein [Vibrio coralliilyticus]NRF82269.1 GspS/AspS pilotin family protein [Vibrio coralliilyticus]
MLSWHKLVILIAVSALNIGCSSSEPRAQLKLLAESRANLLSTQLPLEYGPLSIMSAQSHGAIIELIFIYNETSEGAKPTKIVLYNSLHAYCNSPDTKNNLDLGISYRIKVRNSRGQLIADELITKQRCNGIASS